MAGRFAGGCLLDAGQLGSAGEVLLRPCRAMVGDLQAAVCLLGQQGDRADWQSGFPHPRAVANTRRPVRDHPQTKTVGLGASLAALIRQARPLAGANQLLCTSMDGFTSGTPLQVVFDGRDALLAVAMNGTALPVVHGFPARTVVPGLYGYVSATKWVTDIEVTTFAAAYAYWRSAAGRSRRRSRPSPESTCPPQAEPGPGRKYAGRQKNCAQQREPQSTPLILRRAFKTLRVRALSSRAVSAATPPGQVWPFAFRRGSVLGLAQGCGIRPRSAALS